MKLFLQNNQGEIELPTDFVPKFPALRRRTNFKPRFGQDGSVNVADGRIESGKISFQYMQTSGDLEDIIEDGLPSGSNAQETKDNAYKDFVRELTAFFRPKYGPFYLIDREANLGEGARTEITYIQHQDNPEVLLRVGQNALELQMLSGLWEDEHEQIVSDTDGVTNGQVLTIPNDSDIETFFRMEIAAFSQVQTIKITNQANDQVLEYSNISFGAGNILVIDSTGEEGIVELDGVDNAFALVDGSGFPLIEPGDNDFLFELTSGSVSVVTTYRRRYTI